LKYDASIFDLDMFDTHPAVVAKLHRMGRHVMCYISAGTWEQWRPDAAKFPKSVLGNKDGHWPGERWLDVRQTSILEPIMADRLDRCKKKGFDGVDPDNLDGYQNKTGFPLTYAQHWCDQFNVYPNANRLVVHVEYYHPQRFLYDNCPEAAKNHDTAMLKKLELTEWILTCPKK
jgi:hypothetical protein